MDNTQDKNLSKKKEKTWYVYMHTNKINGKRYVGITSQKPQNRWKKDGSGYKGQTYFWRAIQKYGWDNFKHEILLQDENFEYACMAEKCLIKAYNCRSPNGYNISYGGESGLAGVPLRERLGEEKYEQWRLNQQTCHPKGEDHHWYGVPFKERMDEETYNGWLQKQEANTRRGSDYPMYGISPSERMDEETYQMWLKHIRDNHPKGEDHHWYGVPFKERMDEETYNGWLQKQRERDRSGENNPMYGISPKERMTDDVYKQWLKHVRENRLFGEEHPWYGKRGVLSLNFKPVYCVELNEIFWGSTDVEKRYNIKPPNITQCCQGISKSAGKHPITGEKLHWFYVEDQAQKDGTIVNGAITLGYITQQQLDDYLNNQLTIQN